MENIYSVIRSLEAKSHSRVSHLGVYRSAESPSGGSNQTSHQERSRIGERVLVLCETRCGYGALV